jgi:hypothetical protein
MALIPIIPRHLRVLGRLIEQRRTDQYGCIGWRGLLDDPETFTMDQIFKPLVERGLIEDLSQTPLGHGGTYFVRITPLGQFCYGIGYMIKDARPTTEAEIRKYISDVAPQKRRIEEAQDMIRSRNIAEDHVEGTA